VQDRSWGFQALGVAAVTAVAVLVIAAFLKTSGGLDHDVPATAALAGVGKIHSPSAPPPVPVPVPSSVPLVRADRPGSTTTVLSRLSSTSASLRSGRLPHPDGRHTPSAVPPVIPMVAPAGWSITDHTVYVGGLERQYYTLRPDVVAAKLPVIVLMHGVAMTPAGIVRYTNLAQHTGPAIVVAPAGYDRSWNAGDCCGPAYRAGVNDVAFIQKVVAQVLGANTDANPSRVFAVGFSNGGRMAYKLACDLPGTFAGFAAAEAVPVEQCTSLHPTDITIVAQQNDPYLTIGASQPPKRRDGHVEPTVAAVIDHWTSLDGCAEHYVETYYGQAIVKTWDCARNTRLTYVWYPGGAHTWRAPSGSTPGTTDFVLSLIGARGASEL
jgi:polyhydroxybutyrate depolymerase